MRTDIGPGETFPDYELTDHTKTRRRLSELQGDDPMILVLARGHYCPKDHQQHLDLAASHPKIAVAYTQIVTISTDNASTGSRTSIPASGRPRRARAPIRPIPARATAARNARLCRQANRGGRYEQHQREQ